MQNNLIARISRFLILAPFIVWLNDSPVRAQSIGSGPKTYSASFATPLARYYAPYAIQAAAAYIELGNMDATLRPSKQPPIDGSDVDLVVRRVMESENDGTILAGIKKYMSPWQYQFGSEGFLGCYEQSGTSCYSFWDRLRIEPSGGPAFQVWARTQLPKKDGSACTEVSIAFKGTDFYARADWVANFDQATGYFWQTHYRQLRRNIDAIVKKITTLDCYRRAALAKRPPQIVSVGHSLGGGLAQLAGIANRHIVKVFAFNSSPITGASYVEKSIRKANAEVLEIDRIYQNNEILQLASKDQQYPYSDAPCVRYVEFGVLQNAGPVGLHNMPAFARGIVRLSYPDDNQAAYKTPHPLPNCNSNYVAPGTDENENIGNPLISSRDFSSTRFSAAARRNSIVVNAKTQAPAFEVWPQTKPLSLFQVPQARPVSKLTAHRKRVFG